jgi:cytochrome c oxidase subunit II
MPDVLHGAGPQAGDIIGLWRVALSICGVVFAALLVGLAAALLRAPREPRAAPTLDEAPAQRRRHWRIVAASTIASLVLLFVLIGASVWTDRALARVDLHGAQHIEVTGHQWWWELRYDDADVSRMFSTANELHVPVGRPVVLTLRSEDVIHSLWLPNLGGKKDLVPGRPTTHVLRADVAGEYRGPCAEFCGAQHAGMTLTLIADTPARYDAWADAQRAAAPSADTPPTSRGRDLVEHGSCALCHTVSGTDAAGKMAPDLTHVASRRTIAAGVLPNTPQALAAWIRDPQRHKPGSNMPPAAFPPEDLQAVVNYLGTLR